MKEDCPSRHPYSLADVGFEPTDEELRQLGIGAWQAAAASASQARAELKRRLAIEAATASERIRALASR